MQLPIYSNKVEGHPSDKVVYIKVQDNEMSGFRIMKDDLVFGYLTKELSSNSIYLVEVNGEVTIRQIKTLNSNKVLLISNNGSAKTETAEIKSIKILAKLERVEIRL